MLNLNQNKKKLQILVISIVVLLAGFFIIPILLISKNQKPNLTVEKLIPPQQEIDKIKTESKDIKQKIIDSKEKEINGDFIIKETEKYKIVYPPTLKIFFVTIKAEPVNSSKEEAQKFFRDFGLSQNDLCSLPVRFSIADYTIKNRNKNFNLLPDNCN